MTENNPTLSSFYKGWDNYQNLLSKAIAPLSNEQLAMKAAPNLRPLGEIVAHIISARVWWFHNIMGEGSTDLAPMMDWDEDDAPARSAAELVTGLETTWQLIQNTLARYTPADLEQTFQRKSYTGTRPRVTRQWIIWHLIEHDLHHGGEVSFMLGMHNLPAPDL